MALRRFDAATEAVVRRHGLTARQYDLLAVLHAAPDGRTATELASLLRLTRNATTELITRAERNRLVHRVPDVADARRKSVLPSKVGRQRYLACLADLRPERRRLLAMLDDVSASASVLEEGFSSARDRARS